jgi:DNA-binding transcriptional LysR family regulator
VADQKCTELDWDDVRVFLAVARGGSLSAAARLLRVNHATVSRRLLNLEQRTGSSPLFERSRSGYGLTAVGRLAFAKAEEMEAAAEGLKHATQAGEELRGPVRVSATATVAEHLLVEPLAALALREPGLELHLSAEDRNVSLSRGEADIAIRLGRPVSGDALARTVAELTYHIYATPHYLGSTPSSSRRLIGYSEAVSTSAPGVRRLEELAGTTGFALRCPTLTAQAKAASAGAGMALLPLYLAERHDGLVRVGEKAEPAWRHPVCLVVRSDVRRVGRVRFVADHLATALASSCR